jgi:multidrug efflux system membrane fusion protein
VKRQAVTVGHEDEQESIVTAGLRVGDNVVIDGASRLSDGTKIAVVQPAAGDAPEEAARPSAPGTRPGRSGGG